MTTKADLYLPAQVAGDGTDPVVVTPERAGWTYSGLRVVEVPPGGERILATGADEVAVVPLAGSCEVEVDGRRFSLAGRDSVFDGPTDFAYVPIDSELRLSSSGGIQAALVSARATRRLEPAYGPREGVSVEVRGAGDATRQVNNFLTPEAFPADKLVAVEVVTPDGNFSSYPPHKHDRADPTTGEAVLEEIYYFRFQGEGGHGLFRVYSAEGDFDVMDVMHDGDVFLVPRGYHGPSVAVPGHAMYFLNVLAGPAPERTMCYCDDPTQHWIRESWAAQEPDPRLPLGKAARMA
jgi:5-deoxy-glucuronate isomerase